MTPIAQADNPSPRVRIAPLTRVGERRFENAPDRERKYRGHKKGGPEAAFF